MRTHRKRRTAVAVGALAAAAAVTAGILVSSSFGGDDDAGAQAGPTATPTTASPSINEDGSIALPSSDPTEDAAEVATDPPYSPPPGDEGTVFVTYASWIEASGAVEEGSYVPGIVESGGTCTLTLTQGSSTVSTSAPGEPDATTTSCGGLTIPGDQVTSGTWSAVVSYESPTTSAASEPTEVVVP